MKNQTELYARVTSGIIRHLEQGTAPWVKPWSGGRDASMPYNAASNRPYSGVNVLMLWAEAIERGYDTPGWLTYKQSKDLGGHVRKGERSAFVIYAKQICKTETDSETGEETERQFSILKGYAVFNVAQCDGLPAHLTAKPEPIPEPEGIAGADRFIGAIGATVRHGGGRAFYAREPDYIQLPEKGAFDGIAHYYAASLHEHVHWSGAPHRLDRDKGARYGDQAYAFEELVAEIGAAFLCAHIGIKGQLQHADYLASWARFLKEHSRAVISAAAHASRAADYLRAFSETAVQRAA